MKIIVIYPNGFPIAGAATNRILSLCKVLIEQGNQVKLYITRPTENSKCQLNFKRKGNFSGVDFQYVTSTIIWPESKLLRLWQLFLGKLLTFERICLESRRQKVDIVISAATYNFYENVDLFLLGKLLKYKLVYTVDEYPWVIINKKKYSSFYRYFYLKYFYKMFDGFIAITSTLIDYYRGLGSSTAKFLHLPMSVDFARFEKTEIINNCDYIAYCGGDKSGTKDGIDYLIEAFNLIKDNFPTLNLIIAGEVHPFVVQLISDYDLSLRVKLLGFISREKVPSILVNAKALCLARPLNKQAEGGFPTKLGEYLASGKPVIVTAVGEIPKYLVDGVNAYIAKPGDAADFAKKILMVLANYQEALQVAAQGKELSKTVFNLNTYSREITEFFRALFKS